MENHGLPEPLYLSRPYESLIRRLGMPHLSFLSRCATLWHLWTVASSASMVWLFASIVLVTVPLSGCQFALPGQPVAEEEVAGSDDELEGGEEGESEMEGDEASEEEDGEEARTPKPAPPETHERYTKLEDYHPRVLKWNTEMGMVLQGNLYSPYWEAEALKPVVSTDEEAAEEEEETSDELEEDSEEEGGEDAEASAPPKVVPPAYRYPLIVILHQLSGSQKRAKALVPPLVKQGYAVLLLDLPGHGSSVEAGGGHVKSWREFTPQDWQGTTRALQQVEQYFKAPRLQENVSTLDVLPGKMGIIAEGIGANMALLRAGEKDAHLAFTISVGATSQSKGLSPVMALLKNRTPTLFMASQSEPFSYEDTPKLYRIAEGTKAMRLYGNAGYGLELFSTKPEARTDVLKWANLYLAPKPLSPAWKQALNTSQVRWKQQLAKKQPTKPVHKIVKKPEIQTLGQT
jgi:hypothetical protein